MAGIPSTIKGLGEMALRVTELEASVRFDRDVIGLELMGRWQNAAFFQVAPGYGGRTQALALFDRSDQPGYAGLSAQTTTIDHLAFEIDLADYARERERERLERLGLEVIVADHPWVGWRSLYVHDPDGNMIELVCYDGAVHKPDR